MENKTTGALVPIICGAMAASSTLPLSCPIDVISQRIMVERSHRTTFKEACVSIWRQDGIKGFYRGVTASFFTYAPNSACLWSFYFHFQQKLRDSFPSSSLSTVAVLHNWSAHQATLTAVAGMASGALSGFLTNPLDVIRARKQVEKTSKPYAQIIRDVRSSRGYTGFLRGCIPRMMTMSPSVTLMFSGYELFKRASVDNTVS